MYRILWVVLIFGAFLSSCGGEDTYSEVTKESEILFEFEGAVLRQDPAMIRLDVDIMRQEFEEFLDNLDLVELNSVELQISGLSEENSLRLEHLFIGVDRIQVDSSNLFVLNFNPVDLQGIALPLTNGAGIVTNTDRIKVYDRFSAWNILGDDNAGIQIIKEALKEIAGLQFGVGIDSASGDNQGFSIHIFLNITIRTRLN